jgi:hypothetical protein
MTTGTVLHFDPARGTGTVCCLAGSPAPFALSDRSLATGDLVRFRLVGGMAGYYGEDARKLVPSTLTASAATPNAS